jgi:hypothetical protein
VLGFGKILFSFFFNDFLFFVFSSQSSKQCKNQLTTICNLREALVVAKRGVPPSFVVSSTSNSNRNNSENNSLWTSLWGNVHDV